MIRTRNPSSVPHESLNEQSPPFQEKPLKLPAWDIANGVNLRVHYHVYIALHISRFAETVCWYSSLDIKHQETISPSAWKNEFAASIFNTRLCSVMKNVW